MVPAIVIALLLLATAATGGYFRPGEWYESLRKPGWTPPNWAFPVVWMILYAMIGYAGWRAWKATGPSLLTGLWLVQLFFNAAWSYLFFGRRRMDLAMVDVSIMWLLIAGFIVVGAGVDTIAAALFAPYLLWVTIAAALNWSVWSLNPQAMRSA